MNCVFRNNNMGVEVREGGKAKLYYCQFKNQNASSVCGYDGAISIYMKYCIINGGNDSGVLLSDKCHCEMLKCNVIGAKVGGVTLQNGGLLKMRNCSVSKCSQGLMTQDGKNNADIDTCEFLDNKANGIFICEDCRGKVILNNIITRGNAFRGVNNDSRVCEVFLDSIRMKRDGILSHISDDYNAKLNEHVLRNIPHHASNPTTVQSLRSKKAAGVPIQFQCYSPICKNVEAPNVKFMKCGTCLDALYCSRECQVRNCISVSTSSLVLSYFLYCFEFHNIYVLLL